MRTRCQEMGEEERQRGKEDERQRGKEDESKKEEKGSSNQGGIQGFR